MSGKPTSIYTARTMQDAHLLRNLLAEEGIQALVTNELLEGGSGVNLVGWATSAGVTVPEEDTGRARDIALEFDRKTSAPTDGRVEDASSTEESPAALPVQPWENWPTCLACGARQTTRCPACGRIGSDFPPADFVGAPQVEVGWPWPMLLCPTCDEAFEPNFFAHCEQCGHLQGMGGRLPDSIQEGGVKVFYGLMLIVGACMASYAVFHVALVQILEVVVAVEVLVLIMLVLGIKHIVVGARRMRIQSGTSNPEAIFKEAIKAEDEGEYGDAFELYSEIAVRYPLARATGDARLAIALLKKEGKVGSS